MMYNKISISNKGRKYTLLQIQEFISNSYCIYQIEFNNRMSKNYF